MTARASIESGRVRDDRAEDGEPDADDRQGR